MRMYCPKAIYYQHGPKQAVIFKQPNVPVNTLTVTVQPLYHNVPPSTTILLPIPMADFYVH